MAASKRSQLSVDAEGKMPTKGSGKDKRIPEFDKGFIIVKRIEKGLKRWKLLETEIPRKQRRVAEGYRSKRLEPYKEERDGLDKQVQKDISVLQSIFNEEYRNEFDRKDKKRATTGGIQNENIDSLRSAESKINQLTIQLETERKSKEEALSSLQSAESEINRCTSRLEKERKSKEEAFSRLEAKNKELTNQLENERKANENAPVRLEAKNNQLINQLENERKADVRLTVDKSFEVRANVFKTKSDEPKTELASLEDEKIRTIQELIRLEAKNNQLTTQLESESKAKEDALLSLRSAESEINQLKIALENGRKSREEALLSLRSAESEINQWKIQFEYERKSRDEAFSSLRSAESEINQLKRQLENERKSREQVLSSLRSAESEINQLKRQLENGRKSREEALLSVRSAESEINQLKMQFEYERKSRDEAFSSLRSAESEINQLKRQLENERMSREQVLSRLEARINQLSTQVDNERKAKEDALLRLSSMASSKLRDNNPNIADLSDPNRPTKLSEQFSELYDNEWTDAFDELETQLGDKEEKDTEEKDTTEMDTEEMDTEEKDTEEKDKKGKDKEEKEKKEMEIISYLRDFVVEIHSVCSELSLSKLTTIEKEFVKPSVPSEDTKIPTELLKTIKDGIKSMAPKLLEKTREVVLDRLKEKYKDDPVAGCLQHEHVKRYIDKCTDVCWYMSVQDPQLVMDGSKSPDDKFNSIKHREYTKKGPYEDFVVWPALYLFKGGQMLSKGVAQGKKEMTGQQ